MQITEVRIRKVNGNAFVGYADITIDGCFAVRNIKVFNRNGTYSIAMPSHMVKNKSGKKITSYHALPINEAARQQIIAAIAEEINRQ